MAETPFTTRFLDEGERNTAIAIASASGALGAYATNQLADEAWFQAPRPWLGIYGSDGLIGLAHCGRRANLMVLLAAEIDATGLGRDLRQRQWDWRIVLGPQALVAALARTELIPPLAYRQQIYYAADRNLGLRSEGDSTAAELAAYGARPAAREDVAALAAATVELNREDLGVPAWRIAKDWVRRSALERQRAGTTLVIGPKGAPYAKLDIGSTGPGGMVIEGVYTWPSHRGQGYAARLVSAAIATAPVERVYLHVAHDNLAARRAYEKAGMREAGDCFLLLRG